MSPVPTFSACAEAARVGRAD